MKRRRPRRRSPLPFLLLAVVVVGCAFAAAVAAVVPMEAERDKLDAPAAATPTPTPAPYIPDEAEVEMLARLIWGEARGIPSDMHKAAVVWCVLNRVDAEGWPDTVAEVVTQPHQFAGYSPDYPATEEFKAIAADVLIRWEREKREGGEVGRVLPAEYVFFTGDGEVNHFRTEYRRRHVLGLELEKSIQQLSERSYSNYVEAEAGQAGRRLAVPPPDRNYQVQRGQQRIHEGTPRTQALRKDRQGVRIQP